MPAHPFGSGQDDRRATKGPQASKRLTKQYIKFYQESASELTSHLCGPKFPCITGLEPYV